MRSLLGFCGESCGAALGDISGSKQPGGAAGLGLELSGAIHAMKAVPAHVRTGREDEDLGATGRASCVSLKV